MHNYTKEYLNTLDPEVRKIVCSDPDNFNDSMPVGFKDPFGCQESGFDQVYIQEQGTQGIIDNLVYYVSDAALWRFEWSPRRYHAQEKKRSTAFTGSYMGSEHLTKAGTVRKRRPKIKRRIK